MFLFCKDVIPQIKIDKGLIVNVDNSTLAKRHPKCCEYETMITIKKGESHIFNKPYEIISIINV